MGDAKPKPPCFRIAQPQADQMISRHAAGVQVGGPSVELGRGAGWDGDERGECTTCWSVRVSKKQRVGSDHLGT